MKIRFLGTGTVHVEGAGDVSSGNTIEVNESMGKALVRQDPKQWQATGVPQRSPSTRKRGGD